MFWVMAMGLLGWLPMGAGAQTLGVGAQTMTLHLADGKNVDVPCEGIADITFEQRAAMFVDQIHLLDGTCIECPCDSISDITFKPAYQDYVDRSSSLTLNTDSAFYHPGASVTFSIKGSVPARARVRYTSLGEVIEDQPITDATWTWNPPTEDYRGYMTCVYRAGVRDTLLGTIAVDVSSDWSRFPRYGFVATFGHDKTKAAVATEMEWLNRCHINGVQFQDWHWKHHRPWGGNDDGTPLATYKDIANRTIYTESVENYIDAAHERGMMTMFYNLCYGVLDDAADDGVKEEWYIYKDKAHTQHDSHDLPDSWKSNIYLVNPQNPQWQSYMAARNEEVYAHLAFDGYQIDQLGSRGTRYNNNGSSIDMEAAYGSFIRAMKKAHPDRRLVMNAVSSYGSKQIASTGKVDFLYNEVWDNESQFSDLGDILDANRRNGSGKLQTVFAAYMNYNRDKTSFNAPGVLLTDAVIFALGGSHLELGGDHMLCREYFPYSGLTMPGALKTALTHYYDFMTAYENLLRGSASSTALLPKDTSGRYTINRWKPQLGGITAVSRKVGQRQVIHLLNFRQANSLSWRDVDGNMPRPTQLREIPLELNAGMDVSRVWVATPDELGGVMQQIPFEKEGKTIRFTLPTLLYWTMIVVE